MAQQTSGMFVLISSMSFLIPPAAYPARCGLLITTLLVQIHLLSCKYAFGKFLVNMQQIKHTCPELNGLLLGALYCMVHICTKRKSVPSTRHISTTFSSGSCDHVHQCLVQLSLRSKRVDSACNLDPWKSHPRLHRTPPLRRHPRQYEADGKEDWIFRGEKPS